MDVLDHHQTASVSTPIAILGVPFDNLTVSGAVELIEKMIESRRPHYLVTANVDFLVQGQHDVELRRIMFEADLVLCDGTPLLWASRLLGNALPERVAGSDIVPLLIQLASKKGYRIFFLGGSPESCGEAVTRLKAQHPDLNIVGHYSPPFGALLDMDHDEIKRRIQAARPDFLFVSFGCPKQEKWISMHYRKLGVPVAVGVGATIDFLAGRVNRAPRWMRKTGTEWIYRLAQEPRRLFGRYVRDLWYFNWMFLAQWWRLKVSFAKTVHSSGALPTETQNEWQRITFPERLDVTAVRQHSLTCQNVLANSRCCLLDLSKVRFIDSTGVGMLVHFHKRARASGRRIVLVSPSMIVRRALRGMQLEGFFDLALNEESARSLLEGVDEKKFVSLDANGETRQHLTWQGEITAANADHVWEITEPYIRCQAAYRRELDIDLTPVRFIDSSGLGVMVRAKKAAMREGVRLGFSGMQPNVRNVVRLARLEEYLLESAS